MTADITAKLYALFAHERRALLGADYDALAGIACSVAACLSALAQDPPDKATLAIIKGKLTDNQNLLAAAQRGVEAAYGRMNALQAVRDGLTTYDPSGKVASISTPNHKVERKA